MADCLNCKHCIRQEIYDGQWGMFYFDTRCSAGVFVIKDGKINPWDMPCDKFEHGEPVIRKMTDEEKQNYYPGYISPSKNSGTTIVEGNFPEVVDTLKRARIKVKRWNGKYKSVYTILKEMSKKWSKLTNQH